MAQHSILSIGLAIASFLFLIGCHDEGKTEARHNVVLLVADALRADHLGCYGETLPTSPNLDALALESALFENYYTVVPTTLSSFVSLLTSLHPKDHEAFRNGITPASGLDTLGAAFQRAGYETAFFISSFCLDSSFGTDAGFDHFDSALDQETNLGSNKLIRSAESVTRAFLTWLEQRNQDRPYFAVVHYFDPHWPYIPPKQYARMFAPHEEAPTSVSFSEIRDERSRLAARDGAPSEKALLYRNLHFAEIRYMDTEIGKIIQRLKQTMGTAPTLAAFTADHGETFWEHHDYFNHGLSVYATNIRIPLILWAPGWVPPGRNSDMRFSNIDLGPTLLGLAGAPVPEAFAGEDLHKTVLGIENDRGPEFVFSEATKPYNVEKGDGRPNRLKSKCIMRGSWKLIWTPWEDGREELYNVAKDPLEKNNLVDHDRHAPLLEALRQKLHAWTHEYQAGSTKDEISSEAMESLKELGY